jgi:hypothetical protein
MTETAQTRKTLDTIIHTMAAKLEATCETLNRPNGELRYRINSETFTPDQALEDLTAKLCAQQPETAADRLAARIRTLTEAQLRATWDALSNRQVPRDEALVLNPRIANEMRRRGMAIRPGTRVPLPATGLPARSSRWPIPLST